jgi:hypothetical protein
MAMNLDDSKDSVTINVQRSVLTGGTKYPATALPEQKGINSCFLFAWPLSGAKKSRQQNKKGNPEHTTGLPFSRQGGESVETISADVMNWLNWQNLQLAGNDASSVTPMKNSGRPGTAGPILMLVQRIACKNTWKSGLFLFHQKICQSIRETARSHPRPRLGRWSDAAGYQPSSPWLSPYSPIRDCKLLDVTARSSHPKLI